MWSKFYIYSDYDYNKALAAPVTVKQTRNRPLNTPSRGMEIAFHFMTRYAPRHERYCI